MKRLKKKNHFYILYWDFFCGTCYVKIILDLLINFRKYFSSSQKIFIITNKQSMEIVATLIL